MSVVITGRRKEVLDQAADELGVRAVAFDAIDVAAIEAALPELPDQVDVLVNNAGGNVGRKRPAPDGLAGLRDLWTGGDHIPEEGRALMISQTANGRTGRPADVAGTVAFLASPEAGHITAQVIHVNGGAFRGR
jgi:NAD(P)-dependent dehydrogenase (short-subunit alcohol dehydrogenase family)